MKSFVLIGFLGGGKGYAYFVLFVPSMSWYWMNNKVHTENNNKQQKKSCKHFFFTLSLLCFSECLLCLATSEGLLDLGISHMASRL